MWDRLKRWFSGGSGGTGGTGEAGGAPMLQTPAGKKEPTPSWIAAAENPWKVPVLDVRPVTLGMLSVSQNRQCAENAVSYGNDDGTGFIGAGPAGPRVPAALRYRLDRVLADGVLFIPEAMEHKWAMYFHRGRILFIRSWMREVMAVADVGQEAGHVEVTAITGGFSAQDEDPAFTVRAADFLIRTHALGEHFPAPLPAELQSDPRNAGMWCFSAFGNRAHYASVQAPVAGVPETPLRTDSLLHIALARGDGDAAIRLLDAGLPADLMARDGLTTLHWALARPSTAMMQLLLDRGVPADVRSEEGATPLMNCVQAGDPAKATLLLDRGADPNAADSRGFTALHRAAEMGKLEIARLLLSRGAAPRPDAGGHTPLSLAKMRNESALVELLQRA